MTIVKMKKITLFGRIEDQGYILNTLQNIGVMHIVPFDKSKEWYAKTNKVTQTILKLKNVIQILSNYKVELHDEEKINFDKIISLVLEYSEKKVKLEEEKKRLNIQIEKYNNWGSIELKDIDILQKNGIVSSFFILDKKYWMNLNKENKYYFVSKEKNDLIYVCFFNEEIVKIKGTKVLFGTDSLSLLKEKLVKCSDDLNICEKKIRNYSTYTKEIEKTLDEFLLIKKIEDIKARVYSDDSLVGITGYIPAISESSITEELKGKNLVYVTSKPKRDEDVPVLLKNNKLIKPYEAILETFSGISYHEKDVTWAVAILFVIFGSLCFLDAGYGALLTFLGYILYSKGKKSFGQVFIGTGIVAVFFGVISGQYFGFLQGKDFLINNEPYIPLAIDPMACFMFSLICGIIAMWFSYIVSLWQDGMKTNALGSFTFIIGIICILIIKLKLENILDMMFRSSLSNSTISSVQYYGYGLGLAFMCLGIVAWLFYPEKVFGDAHIPNVLWTLYSGITGLMQDVLSHMRLFGIALSGAILALVVNKISFMFPWYLSSVFILVGHIAVFLLALLSLYIHTNRLIFLEFGSKCIKGGHFLYMPFNRSKKL